MEASIGLRFQRTWPGIAVSLKWGWRFCDSGEEMLVDRKERSDLNTGEHVGCCLEKVAS